MSLIAPEGFLLGAIAGAFAIPLRSRATAEHSISIDTRFGSIALAEREILDTPDGLPGFENSRRFVLIDLESSRFSPFLMLQGIDGGGPSLAVLPLDMRCRLYESADVTAAAHGLGIRPADCGLLVVATIRKADGGVSVTVNQRAPILVDLDRRLAWQRVLANDRYAIRHRLR